MIGSSVFVFCLCLGLAYGIPCSNLSGVWRNELGSNMSIVYLNDDVSKITGQYNTSVESSKGAATVSSPIAGMAKQIDGGSLVAFNVLWNHGASITSWVGQCIVCDGKEMLFTTWALRSLASPIKKWMTTRINQDTFWRLENEVPSPPIPEGPGTPSTALLGLWSSVSGDAFNVTFAASAGMMEGELLTPVRTVGSTVRMFGSIDGNETYTALGFSAAGFDKIKGWTAHIYNPQDSNKIIETSWLAHSFFDSCNNPRKFVNYGMDNYTQTSYDSSPSE